jgi:hypothetical protein
MDAIELILRDHARSHASALGGAEGNFGFQDLLLGGLSDDELRQRPLEGMNSLAWLLWHMARTEDMGVNLIVAGRKPVLEEEGWPHFVIGAQLPGLDPKKGTRSLELFAKEVMPSLQG